MSNLPLQQGFIIGPNWSLTTFTNTSASVGRQLYGFYRGRSTIQYLQFYPSGSWHIDEV